MLLGGNMSTNHRQNLKQLAVECFSALIVNILLSLHDWTQCLLILLSVFSEKEHYVPLMEGTDDIHSGGKYSWIPLNRFSFLTGTPYQRKHHSAHLKHWDSQGEALYMVTLRHNDHCNQSKGIRESSSALIISSQYLGMGNHTHIKGVVKLAESHKVLGIESSSLFFL